MKLSKQWKTLTRDQRRNWQRWAKGNRVLLDSGHARNVSGSKAFTVVLQNRATAAQAANPTVAPTAIVLQIPGALSLRNAGPFTIGGGAMSFRAERVLSVATKWLVWATPPVDDDAIAPVGAFRFVKLLQPGALASNALTPDFAADYRLVHGSFNGPGTDGAWPTAKYIWFRLQQYHEGHVGPMALLRGQIQVEL